MIKIRYVVGFLVAILLISAIVSVGFLLNNNSGDVFGDFFVGVDVAYDSMEDNKGLIDRISGYSNLFVIGCTGITHNESKLDEICQYAFDKGLSFIVYTERRLQYEWVEQAKIRWGERFLGFIFGMKTPETRLIFQ